MGVIGIPGPSTADFALQANDAPRCFRTDFVETARTVAPVATHGNAGDVVCVHRVADRLPPKRVTAAHPKGGLGRLQPRVIGVRPRPRRLCKSRDWLHPDIRMASK